jgi:hypothetical protein
MGSFFSTPETHNTQNPTTYSIMEKGINAAKTYGRNTIKRAKNIDESRKKFLEVLEKYKNLSKRRSLTTLNIKNSFNQNKNINLSKNSFNQNPNSKVNTKINVTKNSVKYFNTLTKFLQNEINTINNNNINSYQNRKYNKIKIGKFEKAQKNASNKASETYRSIKYAASNAASNTYNQLTNH